MLIDMGIAVVRLLLEIRPGSEPVQGRVRGGHAWSSFTGWTELGQTIVRLTDDAIPNIDDERKDQT